MHQAQIKRACGAAQLHAVVDGLRQASLIEPDAACKESIKVRRLARKIEVARAIQEGAAAFLKREYTFLAAFVVIAAVSLLIFVDYDVLDRFGEQHGELTDFPRTAAAYIFGALSSAAAGYAGMYIAVRANVRTAGKARDGLNPALRVAFSSGTVMGVTVTSSAERSARRAALVSGSAWAMSRQPAAAMAATRTREILIPTSAIVMPAPLYFTLAAIGATSCPLVFTEPTGSVAAQRPDPPSFDP